MDMNLWRFVNNHRFFACNYLNTQSSNLCFLQKLTIAMAKPGLLGSFLPRFHRDFDWLWRPDADLLGCQHVTCWHRQWDEEGVEMGSWWPLIAGFLGEDMIIEEGNGVFWPEYGFDSRYLDLNIIWIWLKIYIYIYVLLVGLDGLDCGPLLKNSLWIDPSLADKHGQVDRFKPHPNELEDLRREWGNATLPKTD